MKDPVRLMAKDGLKNRPHTPVLARKSVVWRRLDNQRPETIFKVFPGFVLFYLFMLFHICCLILYFPSILLLIFYFPFKLFLPFVWVILYYF